MPVTYAKFEGKCGYSKNLYLGTYNKVNQASISTCGGPIAYNDEIFWSPEYRVSQCIRCYLAPQSKWNAFGNTWNQIAYRMPLEEVIKVNERGEWWSKFQTVFKTLSFRHEVSLNTRNKWWSNFGISWYSIHKEYISYFNSMKYMSNFLKNCIEPCELSTHQDSMIRFSFMLEEVFQPLKHRI